MAETGFIILIVTLLAAVFTVAASIFGSRIHSPNTEAWTKYGMLTVSAFFTIAFVIIITAFISNDFTLKIVAENSNTTLPGIYTLTAVYADKVGSIFLWGWIISVLAGIFAIFQPESRFKTISLSLIAGIIAFFVILVVFVANVFEKNPAGVSEGFGMNPLLQNIGMLIHPPLLYLGFAGFAMVFAIAIAGLITRVPRQELIKTLRGWTIIAWGLLGMGNLVGMWWSYNELGWGGYWAWDPVENAGLMPWLLGTAFLHSIIMVRQRGYLYRWSLYLAVFSFAFTLLSPFITHGGIESPLHGFSGSAYPPYLLGAILIVIISSVILIYRKSRFLEQEDNPTSSFSREGAFLLTNLILVLITIVILTGTVLPQVIENLGGAKQALNRSFFDRTCGPLFLVLILLMGICPLLGWRKAAWNSIKRNFLYTSIVSVLVAIIFLVTGIGNWYAVGAVICGIPFMTIILELSRGTIARHRSLKTNYLFSFFSLMMANRGRYGGLLTHVGVIFITVGIIGSSMYNMELTKTLAPMESMTVNDLTLSYTDLSLTQDISKASYSAEITVSRNGREIAILQPSLDYWYSHSNFFAEAAVKSTISEDLFVSLAWTDGESATFHIMVSPLIIWIWIGGIVLVAGGLLALSGSYGNQLKEAAGA